MTMTIAVIWAVSRVAMSVIRASLLRGDDRTVAMLGPIVANRFAGASSGARQ